MRGSLLDDATFAPLRRHARVSFRVIDIERACVIVPAHDAAATLEGVVEELRRAIPSLDRALFVVDDGSSDGTAAVAERLGCHVLTSSAPPGHPRGKGAALVAGFEAAKARGLSVAVTVDADGQHPADEARRVLLAPHAESALVLGVRDLVRDGAPRANRVSNGISNFFLSRFVGRSLRDTQCGLRRYPIAATLGLSARGRGYDFEAEVILRAIFAGMDVVEEHVAVRYPEDRRSHFHVARDPWRIIRTVLATMGERWLAAREA
jgi:glycosyltransferase involved in cell wall biosynthesis